MIERMKNYVYYFVGKNIRKYRKQKGWTQEELANKTNYSKQFISNIENEAYQTFSLGTVWKIALVLEIDAYQLLMENKIVKTNKTENDLIEFNDKNKKSSIHN